MTASRPEPNPWDLAVLGVLQDRDGVETFVDLLNGDRLPVLNIAWGYDMGDEYSHVTTNCSPRVAGWATEYFNTSQVRALVDLVTQTTLLECSYEAGFVALHELEGRPAYTWDDAPTSRWQQSCLFCDSTEVVKVHMLEDPTFGDAGDEFTLSAFVTLCARCESLAGRRDLDALTELLESRPFAERSRLIAEAFLRADLGSRDLTTDVREPTMAASDFADAESAYDESETAFLAAVRSGADATSLASHARAVARAADIWNGVAHRLLHEADEEGRAELDYLTERTEVIAELWAEIAGAYESGAEQQTSTQVQG